MGIVWDINPNICPMHVCSQNRAGDKILGMHSTRGIESQIIYAAFWDKYITDIFINICLKLSQTKNLLLSGIYIYIYIYDKVVQCQ